MLRVAATGHRHRGASRNRALRMPCSWRAHSATRRPSLPSTRLYFDPVYRYCYHRLGSWEAAEDATSVVFTKVLAALPRYRSGRPVRSVSLLALHHRPQRRHQPSARRAAVVARAAAGRLPARLPDRDPLTGGNGHGGRGVAQSLHALLAQLSPDQRQVVELRLAGLTDAEIGRVLGRKHGRNPHDPVPRRAAHPGFARPPNERKSHDA